MGNKQPDTPNTKQTKPLSESRPATRPGSKDEDHSIDRYDDEGFEALR